MHDRVAKNNALKAIKFSNDNEIGDEIEHVDVNEESARNSGYTVPMVSQNAPEGYSLDLFKQYKRRLEFCDRDMIRIHDTNVNVNDKRF